MKINRETAQVLAVKKLKTTVVTLAYDDGDETVTAPFEYERIPHKDFVDELAKLCDLFQESLTLSDDATFVVTGYTKSHNKKLGDMITITGIITTASGKNKGASTEAIQVIDGYYHDYDIEGLIQGIEAEALAYLFEKKSAYLQEEMNLNDEEQQEEVVENPTENNGELDLKEEVPE